ncbi:MAG: biopolymer transporter ExbD [Candidatus Omnitrophica bacterium]|nr:biopolymer transporter ExbD [Candidatus Omnitrophota bacterium]
MEFKGRKKVNTQLNIAPLIDVVFLLLIFFMLSSHFVDQPGIKITLPTAVTAKAHPKEDIIIFISRDNKVYLNKKEISFHDLLDELKTAVNNAKNKSVIIKADEKIDLGLAVRVMDFAKKGGAEGLIVSTKPEKDNVE